MKIILLLTAVLLTGCVSHEEASRKLQSDETACAEDKHKGLLRSESEYIACANMAKELYFQSNNIVWLKAPYQQANISQFMKERLSIARDVDLKKLSSSQASQRYNQAQQKLEQRHAQHLRLVEEQERIRQAKLAERDKLAQSCILRYEASQPRKYDTRCYGGAIPDGNVTNGYANCETKEHQTYAPRYIIDQCNADASNSVGLPRF